MALDPRDTVDGWDGGWERAVEDGHQFEENYLVRVAEPYESMRGFHKDRLDFEHYGKNEPEDPYLQ